MSEKKVGKRLLTWVLVLVMTLSLLPLNVLADEIPETDNTPGKVTATKSCTTEPDSNGNYMITLTVQGNPVPSTDTMTTPANADVVLVVDNSGSMETSVGEPCNEPKEYFEKRDYTVLGTGLIVYKCKSCSTKYYEWNQDGNPRPGVPDNCTGEKGETPRITAAKQVSKEFASSILSYEGNRVAVIGFSHYKEKGGIDSSAIKVSQPLTNNPTDVEKAINKMKADGGTNYTAALQQAYDYLNNRSVKEGRPGYVIFISDGAPGLSGESQNDAKWNGSNQATDIKSAGYTLYTVGIALEGPAETYLKSLASADQNEHFINVTGNDYADTLSTVLNQWADKIKVTPTTKPAGTDAVLTDLINTNDFEYVAGSATGGLTVAEDNKTVTWNIREIPKDGASATFKIKAKAGVYGKNIPTNENVYLTYKDANGDDATMYEEQIGKPTVNIAAPQVTLTFDANGGSWETTANVSPYSLNENRTQATQAVQKFTSVASISVEPKRAGYEFDGWYLENDRLYVNVVSVGDSNMTLVAHWKPAATRTYTVVYTDGLTANKAFDDQSTGNLSLGVKTPEFNGTPTRSGYVFTGWMPTVSESVDAPKDGSTVITYTATWEVDNWNSKDNTETGGDGIPDKYQALVKFLPGDLNGKVSGKITQVITMPKTGVEYVSEVKLGNVKEFEVATATPKSGFEFNVWTMNEVTDETKDEAETAVTPEDVTVNAGSKTTFFAHFKSIPTTYTVTYTDGVGGKAFENQQYSAKYDDKTPAFDGTPTREGYTFAGWEPEVAKKVAGDATYTAKWEAKSYTVTYTVDGQVVGAVETYEYGKPVTIREKYVKEGYTVSDWSRTENFTMPAENVVITATSTANTYTVTWKNYDGTVLEEDKNVPYGTTPKYNSATPTRPASGRYTYTFKSWDKDLAPVTGDVIYTATYTETYHRPSTPPSRPSTPTVVIPDDDALGLNTTDHFAYIVGYGNGEVRPQNNITRAEVATIFFRLLTDDVRDENLTKTNRYSDVAATSWYNTAVSTLSSMGIITGYPDGTFRPNAAITRAEFAAIAARFDNDGDKTSAKFSDIATHWAKDEISIAYNNGWITGYPDGTFGPQRDITRAETMTLVNRVLNRQPETEDDLLPNMTVWTDNANPKAWYYLAVQEATNSHYYEFKTNSQYEKWAELRETRDWTQLEK